MKYGIITHYDVHNHGALLQLNGIKQVLKSYGIEAEALQFEKNYDFLGIEMKAKYEISIRSITFYLKYLADKGLSCFWYNFKKKKTLADFKQQEKLVGKYYTEYGDLDAVIVGSDEVFALHTGPTPAFFGHALPSKKVFSYGGCFGPTTIEDIEKKHCSAFVSSGLSNMVGLGMRDMNSFTIAEKLTGKKATLVCDPVILYGYEKEISGKVRPMVDKYMIVYAYDQRMNEPEEVFAIKKYARNHGLKVVSSGFFHNWADKNVNCDPIELLNWFQHTECVVTDTFHGCVMSIITGREMAVKLRDNANKLYNLMTEYEITDRRVDDFLQLEEIFSKSVNWERTNKQVYERREVSHKYLKQMINI